MPSYSGTNNLVSKSMYFLNNKSKIRRNSGSVSGENGAGPTQNDNQACQRQVDNRARSDTKIYFQ